MRGNGIRVLLLLGAVALSTPTRAKETPEMVAVSPQTYQYIAIPDLPSCATGAILRGDPRSGPAWVMLKLASDCRVPFHWHTANEDLVVISGRGTLTMKDGPPPLQFTPGAYASLPSHHVHQASCTRTCLLFSIADGAFDIHYVNADGKDISAKEALQSPAPAKTKSPPSRMLKR